MNDSSALDSSARARSSIGTVGVKSIAFDTVNGAPTSTLDIVYATKVDINSNDSGTVTALDFSNVTSKFVGGASTSYVDFLNSQKSDTIAAIKFATLQIYNTALRFNTNAVVTGTGVTNFDGIAVESGKVDWQFGSTAFATYSSVTVNSGAAFEYNGGSDFALANASIAGTFTFNGSKALSIKNGEDITGTVNYNSSANFNWKFGTMNGTLNYGQTAGSRSWTLGDLCGTLNYDNTKDFFWDGATNTGTINNTNTGRIVWINGAMNGRLITSGRLVVQGSMEVAGDVFIGGGNLILMNTANSYLALNKENALTKLVASTKAEYDSATDKTKFYVDGQGDSAKYYKKDYVQVTVAENNACIEVGANNRIWVLYFSKSGNDITMSINLSEGNVLAIGSFGFLAKATLQIYNYDDLKIFIIDSSSYNMLTEIIATNVSGDEFRKADLALVSGVWNGENGYWLNTAVPESAEWAAIFGDGQG